jgi:hypothetical protein
MWDAERAVRARLELAAVVAGLKTHALLQTRGALDPARLRYKMRLCRHGFPGYRIGVSLRRHPVLFLVFCCPGWV